MGGVQTHKRMVASLEKQIAVQEKKLEQVRHIQIFLTNIILFEEFIWCESGFSFFFSWVFIAHLSTVSNLNNQIMTPESGIMDGQGQNKVHRLPRLFFPRLLWARLAHRFSFWPLGPFLERPGNFKITTCWIVAQFQAYKPVNFASLNDSFLVSFLKIIETFILNANTTSLKHISGPEKFRGLSRNRPLLHLRACSQAIWQPVVHLNSLWWSSVVAPTEAMHLWGTENGLFRASGN